MDTPAETVIEKLGGAQAVAALCGLDVASVHKWKYPKERGGTGGIIPSRHQGALLAAARRLGIGLSAEDFFDTPSTPAADRLPTSADAAE